MKVLWVLNLIPPVIGKQLGKECSVKEGWISGLLSRVIAQGEELGLGICCPVALKEEEKRNSISVNNKNIDCYGFWEDSSRPELYEEEALVKRFEEIFSDFEPDILHIFGTEYGHCLAAAKAFHRPKRVLIGLQGIISLCAGEYMADLPKRVYEKNSFRDWLKQDGMVRQQEKFARRGEWEKQALLLTANVTGRTDFDRKAAAKMNPHARYFSMNETLREEFYEGKWKKEDCILHRIFFSQADYPLKGFHYLLQALPLIQSSFADVTVAVAGNSLMRGGRFTDRLKISAYGKYMEELITGSGLEGKIAFLGKLSAAQMKEEYLKCHTFVCASSLENSPNSVGEAMCLGVPVVASDVGGIPSMLTHEKEGLLFEKGNTGALAGAIERLWRDDGLCERLSQGASFKAKGIHNGEKNFNRLMEIYGELMKA